MCPSQEYTAEAAGLEAARLEAILASLPATLEEDAAALSAAEAAAAAGDAAADMRVTELLRFRVVRKAALRGRAGALRDRALDAGAADTRAEL